MLYLIPAHVALSIPLLLHIFTAYPPSHRCYIKGCDDNVTTSLYPHFLNFTTPRDHNTSTFLRDADAFDPCQTYARNFIDDGTCLAKNFDSNGLTTCTDGYVYDQSEFEETVTTQLDLVCDKDSQRLSLGSIMMLGLLIGSTSVYYSALMLL